MMRSDMTVRSECYSDACPSNRHKVRERRWGLLGAALGCLVVALILAAKVALIAGVVVLIWRAI